MSGYAQVFSAFILHHVLDPEHGLVQRFDGTLVVRLGQTPGVRLVPAWQTETLYLNRAATERRLTFLSAVERKTRFQH